MSTLIVEGMTCGHCEQSVREALGAVAGVTAVVEVDRHANRAVVEGEADVAELVAAVTARGFGARAGDTLDGS